jgi:Flp pilus assembly protein protease CpaA
MTQAQSIFAVAAVLLAGAAIGDLLRRRILNAFVVALLGLAAIRIATDFDPKSAACDLAAAIALLLPMLLAWRWKCFGGGDVKLAFACALLVGYGGVLDLVVLTALLGGVLAVLFLAQSWAGKSLRWSTKTNASGGFWQPVGAAQAPLSVPYGVAIALGCGLTLFLRSPLG